MSVRPELGQRVSQNWSTGTLVGTVFALGRQFFGVQWDESFRDWYFVVDFGVRIVPYYQPDDWIDELVVRL